MQESFVEGDVFRKICISKFRIKLCFNCLETVQYKWSLLNQVVTMFHDLHCLEAGVQCREIVLVS